MEENFDRIVRTNGDVLEISPKNGTYYTLEELQNVVQGYIEIVSATSGNEIMVLNEEGKLEDLPFNFEATCWMKNSTNITNDYVVGDVLICDKKHIK